MSDFILVFRRHVTRGLSILCLLAIVVFSGSFLVSFSAALVMLGFCLDLLDVERAVTTLERIAKGDRFVAFPRAWLRGRTCAVIAEAGERMRADLIEADAAIADQRRMLAEARIRRDGATFFTMRFQESVARAVSEFQNQGAAICATVEGLAGHNAGLIRKADDVSSAATAHTDDVKAISQAAADIADLVAATSQEIAGSRTTREAVLDELEHARVTIQRLTQASTEISTIIDAIRSVSSQTSLLALNATIEAARAGEKGLGFAVVAGEVKTLATRSEQATETIRLQIEEIQDVVHETSAVIEKIMREVASLTAAHDAFSGSLSVSAQAIESVGSRADSVVTRVVDALPDLAAGVGRIEESGRAVLDNARSLLDGSEKLVQEFRSFFADLASGSIKVGILHSLSGTLTAQERPLHDFLVGLVEETNKAGGLLGRPLEALIVNPRAEAEAYARGARALFEAGAAVVFGCWTSQSRLAVAPVVREARGLLFYPSQYEGGGESPGVVFTGATAQQQAWPALDYLFQSGFRRLVVIGHPSAYSRGTHQRIREYAAVLGLSIVRDIEVPDRKPDWHGVVRALSRIPGGGGLAVVSTLSGDATASFLWELDDYGFGSDRLPVLSLSVGELEVAAFAKGLGRGRFVAWPYLQSLDTPHNAAFLELWRRICGDPTAVANDALSATYLGFRLWKNAVLRAGTIDPMIVRRTLVGMEVEDPSGLFLNVTPDLHLTLPAFVGRIEADGTIPVVWAGEMRDPAGRSVRRRPAVKAA